MRRIAIWGYSGNYGGIECLIYNLYKNINREEIQFDFLVSHDYGEIVFEHEILAMGGRVFRILYSEKESLIKSRSCWLKFFREHPEVEGIHVHANIPYAFPLVMAKKAGISLRILPAHNSNMLCVQNKFIRIIREIKTFKEINYAPTTYLACSEDAAKFMFPNKPYIWLKNGIDIDKFDYNEEVRNELRKEFDISEGEVLLGIVGRLDHVKNPLYTVDIFNEYLRINSKAKLVIIGDGVLRKEVESKLERYGIRNRVLFTGLIKDTSKWYQAMDLLLFPSRYEGLGIVLIEAQISGLPCLISDKVPKSAQITDLVQRMSIESNPKIWAECLDKMLKNNRKSYKEEVLKAEYDIKQSAKKLQEIYLDKKDIASVHTIAIHTKMISHR